MRDGLTKKWTPVVLVLLAVSAFFMTNAEMPDWAYVVSSASILLFFLPSFVAAKRWLGLASALILTLVLGFYAFLIESVAIATGFPYGDFEYSSLLGFKIGTVPWTVFFAWTPLILLGYTVAAKMVQNPFVRVVSVAAMVVLFDMVLDPGAVKMSFWQFEEGGWFYGVPISNFVGWVISGALGAVIIEAFVRVTRPLLPVPVQLMQSGALTVFFWTFAALFAGMYIPAALGIVLIALLAWIYNRYHYYFDDMVVLVDEDNEPIGTAPKLPTHTDKTPLHRAFSIFLFNSKGELLLQQRAEHKKTWGGVWSNSCCGHVMLHEPVEAAAKRRLKFEMGMTGIKLHNVLPDYRYKAEKDGIVENEFCPVFVGITDKDPSINPEEVGAFQWVPWEEFLEAANDPESEYSPWAKEEARLLSERKEFRRLVG